MDPFPSLRGRSTIQHAGAGSRATITKPEGENKGAIGQPEVFLDNKAEENSEEVDAGSGAEETARSTTPLRSSHLVAHAQAWQPNTGRARGETTMSEGNKIAAALLACEASRQQQEIVKAGPGRPLAARDVAAELWTYFEGFLERIERDRGRTY